MQNLIFLHVDEKKKIVISWVKRVKKKSTKFRFLYQNVGVNTKILHQSTKYSAENLVKSMQGT